MRVSKGDIPVLDSQSAALRPSCVIVFCKAPEVGAVKTRLIPALGPEAACALHQRMARRTLRTAHEAKVGPVLLFGAPDTDHPFFHEMQRRWSLSLYTQAGADLGERMYSALTHALNRFRCALLIGTDCPALRSDDLRAGVRACNEGTQLVIGPAADGGYYLIGGRTAPRELFQGIEWGTHRVLEATRRRCETARLTREELPVYPDVDRPEDLSTLQGTDLLPSAAC